MIIQHCRVFFHCIPPDTVSLELTRPTKRTGGKLVCISNDLVFHSYREWFPIYMEFFSIDLHLEMGVRFTQNYYLNSHFGNFPINLQINQTII